MKYARYSKIDMSEGAFGFSFEDLNSLEKELQSFLIPQQIFTWLELTTNVKVVAYIHPVDETNITKLNLFQRCVLDNQEKIKRFKKVMLDEETSLEEKYSLLNKEGIKCKTYSEDVTNSLNIAREFKRSLDDHLCNFCKKRKYQRILDISLETKPIGKGYAVLEPKGFIKEEKTEKLNVSVLKTCPIRLKIRDLQPPDFLYKVLDRSVKTSEYIYVYHCPLFTYDYTLFGKDKGEKLCD